MSKRNWYGETWFIFHLIDNTGTYEKKGYITVTNRKDPVENVRIVPVTDITNISEDEVVTLKVEYDDPDNGEFYVYIDWDYDYWDVEKVDNDHKNGYTYLTVTCDPGTHTFSVEVSKGSYNDDMTDEIDIVVNSEGDSGIPQGYIPILENEYKDDEKVYRTWLMIHILVLIFLCLVPFLVFIVRTILKRRKDPSLKFTSVEKEVKG